MKHIPYYKLTELFEESFNDAFGTVVIGPYKYSPASILERIDSKAYEEEFTSFLVGLRHSGLYKKKGIEWYELEEKEINNQI